MQGTSTNNDYANKIMSKQHKHDDKSKPRKDRLSRIGYKWPNNPDRLDLDIDLL